MTGEQQSMWMTPRQGKFLKVRHQRSCRILITRTEHIWKPRVVAVVIWLTLLIIQILTDN